MTDCKPRILVVDDDASIGQVLQAGLELNGFNAKYEAHSANAVKTCLEFHPDLVLLDVDMPGKDGREVASELENHPTLGRTPLIFLTSLVRKEDQGQSASCRTFLAKPLPLEDLVMILRAALEPQPSL